MLRRAYLFIYFGDIPILVDQECSPQYSIIFLAYEFFGSPNAIKITNLMTLVRKQWKLKLELLFKFNVRFHSIRAYAQNDHTCLLIGRVIIPKVTGFLRTARCIVLRIKI